jgi:1-deoxy-D-xylulose-5-phosphate reductoisomerase
VSDRRSVAVLGATGSIGTQTLDVLDRETERFTIVALGGGRRVDELCAAARQRQVPLVVVATVDDARAARDQLPPTTNVVVGEEGLAQAAQSADIVVNAVVGFAGLTVTLAALAAGKRLALANKESLVAAAPLVQSVRAKGGTIVPIDSEHCALHQCLAGVAASGPDVARLILTASGGPFRTWSDAQLDEVTVADALAHPTWSMGPKITVDSSTLMNKGLEVLEAAALFDVPVESVSVVVHPQSVVHSMVEFVDGATIAQLSWPDMRLPIAYCLGLPVRLPHGFGRLAFDEPLTLTFEAPDRQRFPALDLAYEVGRAGGGAPAWLSAANEVAVAAFLDGTLAWRDIVPVVRRSLDQFDGRVLDSVATLRHLDADARAVTTTLVER